MSNMIHCGCRILLRRYSTTQFYTNFVCIAQFIDIGQNSMIARIQPKKSITSFAWTFLNQETKREAKKNIDSFLVVACFYIRIPVLRTHTFATTDENETKRTKWKEAARTSNQSKCIHRHKKMCKKNRVLALKYECVWCVCAYLTQ